MMWRSEGAERTQRSRGMVINRLTSAASLGATKDVAVIPNLTEKKNTQKLSLLWREKNPMFAVHACQENRCHMCMKQLCEFASHILYVTVDH